MRIAFIERHTIRGIFNGVAIEIDFEFVHAFRMVAGNFGFSKRVTHIERKYGAGFATEHIQIGDVEADVLPGDRRVEMV
jgi:hypothetical protein